MQPIKQELSKLLAEALKNALGGDAIAADIESCFEVPREEKFGDISNSIILRIAKDKKKPPRALAAEVHKSLEALLAATKTKGRIVKISVDGPGFLNFYYSDREIANIIPKIHKEGENFGKPSLLKKKNILLEFVSANPTGPLTVAHGRQAAIRWRGFSSFAVTRSPRNITTMMREFRSISLASPPTPGI